MPGGREEKYRTSEVNMVKKRLKSQGWSKSKHQVSGNKKQVHTTSKLKHDASRNTKQGEMQTTLRDEASWNTKHIETGGMLKHEVG